MRQRMVLQNLSPRTIVSYLNGPRQLIRYYNTPPHEITSDQILSYLVYLKEEKQQKRNTMRITVNGIRYLYKHFLNRPEICDQIPYPKAERYIPEVLTGAELKRLFLGIKNQKHCTLLKLIYSAGLRRGEACNILLSDIDTKNMQVRVRGGKGRRDRYVMLSRHMLVELSAYIHECRPQHYLFNGRKKGTPITASCIRWALCQALKREGLQRGLNVHSLRHSFASHLLSMGVNLMVIRDLLGHQSILTTMIYLHINYRMKSDVVNPLDKIFPVL
jgi:integrase/recombinase XerD